MTNAPAQINLPLAVVSVLRFYFQSSGHFDCINEPVFCIGEVTVRTKNLSISSRIHWQRHVILKRQDLYIVRRPTRLIHIRPR